MNPQPAVLSPAQIANFHQDGYVVLPAVLPQAHLDLLRGGAQHAIDDIHAQMDAAGTDTLFINHRGKRYFATNPSYQQANLYDFVYSPLMAGIVRQLIGPTVHVFWEQYVIKAGDGGHAFSWHQDSGYIEFDHPPYLTCWVALDDMSEVNGSIYVLPTARAPGKGAREPHRQDPVLNDMVGYDGPDPGELVVCPAGSIALFSSRTLHRSGANRTPKQRRVFLIQYSGEVIRKPDGAPWGRSECFLRDGQLIASTKGSP